MSGTCQTGGGFGAAMCNNKLIGARYYVTGFNAAGSVLSDFEYVSPRDGDGHGSHTASTSGGNSGADVVIGGAPLTISGIAPRARLAAYKVCWTATVAARTGCYTSDSIAAIDDAVADGVDVINLSVSGTQTNYLDPVEVAFFNASAAGVFVAVSAGNAGPANTVAHPSPWLMTVAASTDYKVQAATAALGNGANYGGYASSPYTPVSSSPLIDSQMAGPAGKDLVLVKQCWLGTLDTAMVGAPDPERFAYGAGHLNPNGAAVQGLVYDASPADYLRFLCGIGSLSPVSSYCTTFCSIPPWDLNLGSLTASSVVGAISLNRTVKNVTTASQPYNASASLPGFNVGVVPSSLTLAPGASDSFKVNLTRTTAPIGFYSFGNAASRP